jgi:mannose-6-phosphate isomerase
MELYPLRFEPILKDRLWGGEKLKTLLDKPGAARGMGESWELSGVEGDVSVVANGPYSGMLLSDLIREYGPDLLGESVIERFGSQFPILIKFIDAEKDLSIQLHPGDELARKRHNSFGKTEMWYIMEADPGAELIIGFNKDTNREEYSEALSSDNLLGLLHYEPVAEGDTYFINCGKIHAIGAGILLAEIQQTSDVTYRVYDFNRLDAQGRPRELHTDLALDAMDYRERDDFRIRYEKRRNQRNAMVDSVYFKTDYLEYDATNSLDLSQRDSFTACVCVGGQAEVEIEGHRLDLVKGETILIPAAARSITIHTAGCQLLEVSL